MLVMVRKAGRRCRRGPWEYGDVGSDVRFLLFSKSGRYKRQDGMETRSKRGVSGVLKRTAMQGGQIDP